jgi:excisionase family DNA binding protein
MLSATSPASDWLTAIEAADLIRCSPRTVYRLADDGSLRNAKAIGAGKVRRTGFRVPRSSVEAYLAASGFNVQAA